MSKLTPLPGPLPISLQNAPKVNRAFEHSRDPSLAVQRADLRRTEAERRRDSFMVKRERPKPMLRPSPHMAYGPDRSAFNARWENEHRTVSKLTANTKQERKGAFMKERQAPTQTKTKSHNKERR